MVLHDHDRSGGQVRADSACGSREDDGTAAGRDAGAQGVDHLDRREALVQVAAPAEDEDPAPVKGDRPGMGPVATRRVRREVGQRVESDGVLARPQDLGRPREAAAEHDEHVVVVVPEAARQLPGGLRRPLGGILHATIVEGDAAQAA
jgi:hypothetical protein